MQSDGSPYVRAANNGDLATLRCLRRLGCPWGPATRGVFSRVAGHGPLAALRWLREAGCPVDWAAVEKRAGSGSGISAEVRVWLLEELQRHRQEEQQR